MAQLLDLDFQIKEMAERIRTLREVEGFTTYEMAAKTGISNEEYVACEKGEGDLTYAFLYRCASALKVDVTDIIEGHSPTLNTFTVTRNGAGQKINDAHGMTYYNLAYAFRNRIADPLYVLSRYKEGARTEDIELTTHDGQEMDIVISGQLYVQIGEHGTTLNPGDSVYFDSAIPHGEMAVGGQDCEFYAIVLNPTGEPMPELLASHFEKDRVKGRASSGTKRVYRDFIDVETNEDGKPLSIQFKNTERFNFAFDLVDKLADTKPEKLAMLHLDKEKNERRITFQDVKKESARCANYFTSLGIGKGDVVLLTLKKHYQFWYAMIGLNKIGAIAVPAVSQLQAHDFEYRFNSAGVKAVLATADGTTAEAIDEIAGQCPTLEHRILVDGLGNPVEREGWRDFNTEYAMFSSVYDRPDDAPCGDDLMLMYFTSGTSGYPKMVTHNYKYPLGHFHTAKFWHNVDPEGLHFTISDTGWAKAMWGKLYGQWLAEAATFVYDFDRFDAADIMPLFAKYQITTFCAPPTMLRMMIKQDIGKYDFSSVQHMTTAGEALNPEVYRQFEKLTGLQIVEGFGQTESTMIIGNMTGSRHKIGSMGKPAPIFDVHLLDPDGNEVPDGETGEICINISEGIPCGLTVGYYKNPEKTKEVMHDGFYHTGDTAWRDEDGYYWYVGRVDDIIKSSGYRIGPFEIESVIMELPYVLECGVSAAPDEVRGQIVKASIVLTPGTEGNDELVKEIQRYVKEHTAPYKYPRMVVFRDELPKTFSGKIKRNEL